MSEHPDSPVIDRQSGSAWSASADDAAAMLVGAVKRYGSGQSAVVALDEVTIAFPAGKFTAVMGPSGSGKSTMMHCAAGLDQLTSGRAFVGSTDLSTLDDRELTRLRRERIGFVFQAFNLVATLTVEENICLPLTLSGRQPSEGVLDQVVSMLRLGDRMHHRPSELSGGQQQRVAVARALVARPRWCSPTSPPATSTLGPDRRSSDSSAQRSTSITSRSSWSPTIPTPLPGRTRSCSSPTAECTT